jgi:hypothetical protein
VPRRHFFEPCGKEIADFRMSRFVDRIILLLRSGSGAGLPSTRLCEGDASLNGVKDGPIKDWSLRDP